MVLMTCVLAVPCCCMLSFGVGQSSQGGISSLFVSFDLGFGPFLTGDAFQPLCIFEVLLIASYGLMIHGDVQRVWGGDAIWLYNLLCSTPIPVQA